jgi:predicted branched-subunit amino acid permease
MTVAIIFVAGYMFEGCADYRGLTRGYLYVYWVFLLGWFSGKAWGDFGEAGWGDFAFLSAFIYLVVKSFG